MLGIIYKNRRKKVNYIFLLPFSRLFKFQKERKLSNNFFIKNVCCYYLNSECENRNAGIVGITIKLKQNGKK
jgi:hypothetical protein